MNATVQTVLGPVCVDALGKTLMHEHLQVAVPGWTFDILEPPMPFSELVRRCVDHIERLKDEGFASMVDPCPIDLGRDVELMAEVSSRTGFNIICATGFYHSEIGASTHWKVRLSMTNDTPRRLADLMIREITEGVGETGVKPGIIKIATGQAITAFEEALMDAAAMASRETGTPITTHTEGIFGDLQVDRMAGQGANPAGMVISHCCGSNDLDYHRSILGRGAYIGFDRFGMDMVNSDENRVETLARLLAGNQGERIVVSHDCVLCFRGLEDLRPLREPGMLHFSRNITPMLHEHGVTDRQIDMLLCDNPRRFFAGGASPA